MWYMVVIDENGRERMKEFGEERDLRATRRFYMMVRPDREFRLYDSKGRRVA